MKNVYKWFSFRLSLLLLLMLSCKSAPEKRATPYVIARPTTWESINLFGAERKLSGFSDDLLFQIAKTEDFEVQVVPADRNTAMALLNSGSIDGMFTAWPPDEQNQKVYRFSEPYFITGPVLIVRINSPYQSLRDLEGREVGFARNYQWALMMKDTLNMVFRPYDNTETAFDDLVQGHVDALVLDAVTAYNTISGPYRFSLRIATKPLLTMGVRVMTKIGHADELVPLFNKGLEEVKKENLYSKILRYWGLFDASNPASAYTESPAEF